MTSVMIIMLRLVKRTWLVVLAMAMANSAPAFSLLGQFETWQVTRIGNGAELGDIGGSKNLGEGYRWNLKPIYYGFDKTFKDYFGQRGCDEIRKAMNMLNSLPAMSKLSSNLAEYPTDTRRVNYRASALGLLDLKSYALAAVLEQLGLNNAERFVWTLRDRVDPVPIYLVIMRNFDPVTWAPSRYVNDTLYTYYIYDDGTVADAVEYPVDPVSIQFTSVSSAINPLWGGVLRYGDFFTGLTRDDVGGLRYLYAGSGRFATYHMEGLVTDANTNASSGGAVWTPVGTAQPVVSVALRAGIDKLTLKEGKYDSILGPFITFTNVYKDTYITNGHKMKQTYERVLIRPDIVFNAADLDGGAVARVVTADTFINNFDIQDNGIILGTGGPGIVGVPPEIITFSRTGPSYLNDPVFFDEQTAVINFIWGSFDGSTNEPFVYPQGSSIQDLEMRVLGSH